MLRGLGGATIIPGCIYSKEMDAALLLAPVAVLCSFAGAFLATRVWLLIHHRG